MRDLLTTVLVIGQSAASSGWLRRRRQPARTTRQEILPRHLRPHPGGRARLDREATLQKFEDAFRGATRAQLRSQAPQRNLQLTQFPGGRLFPPHTPPPWWFNPPNTKKLGAGPKLQIPLPISWCRARDLNPHGKPIRPSSVRVCQFRQPGTDYRDHYRAPVRRAARRMEESSYSITA